MGIFESIVGSKIVGSAVKAGINFPKVMESAGIFAEHAYRGGFGRTATGALYGGTIGAAYGMASDNTSVLGGMAIGAGVGAGPFHSQTC